MNHYIFKNEMAQWVALKKIFFFFFNFNHSNYYSYQRKIMSTDFWCFNKELNSRDFFHMKTLPKILNRKEQEQNSWRNLDKISVFWDVQFLSIWKYDIIIHIRKKSQKEKKNYHKKRLRSVNRFVVHILVKTNLTY